ncbi:signal peptidase II [Pseudarthrobacter sp. J75]|nr:MULTISPECIES: signal peptidase II [unclassified Pseudarthrobacter]MEE2522754.1 signal peptidase II [Pseudarthrobacter sp. J47]MEE2529615.1 signal peptidase II [Pseudarthrobacter sp. J75]
MQPPPRSSRTNESTMTDDTPSPSAAPRPQRKVLVSLFAGFAVFAYVFDQLTKLWVTANMVEGQQIPVLPPLLHWYFIRNSGAAFSIGENITWVFSLVMAAVSVAILFQVRKLGSKWWALSLGLLLGGALGNLTDRLFREPSFGMGHVVDFIQLPNFAIFNIADSAVVSAVVIICLLTLKGIPLDGIRHEAGTDAGKGSGPDAGAGSAKDSGHE